MAAVKRPRTVPARRGTERPIAQKAAELTGKVEGKKGIIRPQLPRGIYNIMFCVYIHTQKWY